MLDACPAISSKVVQTMGVYTVYAVHTLEEVLESREKKIEVYMYLFILVSMSLLIS